MKDYDVTCQKVMINRIYKPPQFSLLKNSADTSSCAAIFTEDKQRRVRECSVVSEETVAMIRLIKLIFCA